MTDSEVDCSLNGVATSATTESTPPQDVAMKDSTVAVEADKADTIPEYSRLIPVPLKSNQNGSPRQDNSQRGQQNGRGSGFRGHSKNQQNNNNGDSHRARPNSSGKKSEQAQPASAAAKSSEKSDEEKKFSTRSRLFVGNLSSDTTEDDVKKMFAQYTQAAPEVFLDKQKMFAFVRVDTRSNAEKAKTAIDGVTFKGRIVRVRFAAHSAGIKVKNLGQNVSNELLHRAFERFGEIDKAVVVVDDKGRPCGEGIVYFSRKPAAMQALHRVNEGIFLLGASPRPVVLEMLEEKDVEDGLPEVHVANRTGYQNEIVETPHLATPGSLEFEFGQRWKKLLDDHQAQIQQIERVFQSHAEELEKEMEKSIDDFEINKIKQTIAQETLKMRQLEERKAQRRGGNPQGQQQQQQQQNFQQNMIQQQQGMQQNMPGPRQGLGQQLQGMPPVPPPGFGLPVMGQGGPGQRLQGPGGPPFMEPFPLVAGPGPNMLMLPNGSFIPNGPMGPGMRMPGQFGGPPGHFEQQHFDPNIAGLGQRGNDYDFKRAKDGRGHDPSKRPRN